MGFPQFDNDNSRYIGEDKRPVQPINQDFGHFSVDFDVNHIKPSVGDA